jgi:hypothetical protein
MGFFKDETTHEFHILFPEEFFEPVPTKDDLVWGNDLDCLCEEWFALFDRLAYLQFVPLPQQINRDNAVDPVYHKTLKNSPGQTHKEERANRLKVPKKEGEIRPASVQVQAGSHCWLRFLKPRILWKMNSKVSMKK